MLMYTIHSNLPVLFVITHVFLLIISFIVLPVFLDTKYFCALKPSTFSISASYINIGNILRAVIYNLHKSYFTIS